MDTKWYTAHIVLRVRYKDGEPGLIAVMENIHLVYATDEATAWSKAEKLGHAAAGDCNGSFRYSGRPAEWVFAGVRRLTSVVDNLNDALLNAGETNQSTIISEFDGKELTWLDYSVASEEEFAKLLAMMPAQITITDHVPPDRVQCIKCQHEFEDIADDSPCPNCGNWNSLITI